MPKGSFGRIGLANAPCGSDFNHFEDNIAGAGVGTGIVFGAGLVSVGGVGLVSVNEGSLAWTVDEPGGIIAITTDTGDNDNACLVLGVFRPTDGGLWMECRFKFDSITLAAVFFGFSEAMAFDTPVMPAEFATATMTYNGTGGMIGASLDPDGTIDDFRAVGGNAGAASGDADTNGTRASETITADEWYIGRVEVDNDGTGRVYLGHDGGLDGDLALVKEFNTAVVTPGDLLYGVLMIENRSAAARVLEVDYLYAQGGRDWAV